MPPYLPALFLTYGHELAYEPVNDRPRLKGASKYTNLGRALIGLYNLCRRQPAPQADLAAADCGRSVENVAGEKARANQGIHRRPSGRARDVCLQYLFHLARRARAELGQCRLT
jgi:hypothetical protein